MEQTNFFHDETNKHKQSVMEKVAHIQTKLAIRAAAHDNSKFSELEANLFIEMTPKLKNSTYGSEEYKQFLKDLKPALDHHYKYNRHHPEYHKEGIKGMSLVDLIEMICDWLAATERHADGNIFKSIEINQGRFNYSDELKQIFINTIKKDFDITDEVERCQD